MAVIAELGAGNPELVGGGDLRFSCSRRGGVAVVAGPEAVGGGGAAPHGVVRG